MYTYTYPAYKPQGFGQDSPYPTAWTTASTSLVASYEQKFQQIKHGLDGRLSEAVAAGAPTAVKSLFQRGLTAANAGIARLLSYRTVYASVQPTIEVNLLNQWYQDAYSMKAQGEKELAAWASMPAPTLTPSYTPVPIAPSPVHTTLVTGGGPVAPAGAPPGILAAAPLGIPVWGWALGAVALVAITQRR